MSRTEPDSHSEEEPPQQALQKRVAAMWAAPDLRSPETNHVLQQHIAKILGYPDDTEREQQALDGRLGPHREAVISKWMAKPDMFSGDNAMPLAPLRTSPTASASARSKDLPTTSTSAMDTSEAMSPNTTNPKSPVSPLDPSTHNLHGRTNESGHKNRYAPRSDVPVSRSSRFSPNDNQQTLLPAKKKQKQDRPKAMKSTDAQAPSLAPTINTSSSSSVTMAQTSHTDTSSLFVEQVDRYPVKDLPKWYTSISDKSMKTITKNRPPSLTSLESLKNCIGRCEELFKKKSASLSHIFDELRNHVHKAEIVLQVNSHIARKARILHPENGLPRIFNEDANFPADLKADSYQLYLRWWREDFKEDVLRGIDTVKGPNRGSDKLNQSYKADFPTSAKHYGDEDLVNGQCWPSQLCLVRDGVHGSSQGGIFGDKEKGTYSIVLSGGGGYHDQDDGNSIWYSGTDGKDFTPTEATQQMILSASIGNVIRVIRSCNLKGKNKYRPEVGFRYDGLYQIKKYELVDKEKQIYRFNLHRCPGQQKIRWGDDAMSRPTKFEIDAYKALKTKYRW